MQPQTTASPSAPTSHRPAFSLRHALTIGLLGLGLTLVGLALGIEYFGLNARHQSLMLQRASGLAQVIGAELQARWHERDATGVARLMQRLREVPHLRSAVVCDDAGRVQEATLPTLVGRPVSVVPPACLSLIQHPATSRESSHSFTPDGRTLWLVHPLGAAAASTNPEKTSGLWLCTESDVGAQRQPALDALLRRTALFATIVLAVCTAFSFLLDRMLTRRVATLLSATREVANGRLDAKAHVTGSDELAELGRGFNQMADNLRAHDAALRASEERLAAHRDLLEGLARGQPLSTSLEAICRFAESQSAGMLGSILLLDPDGVRLRHGAAPNLPAAYCQAVDGLVIGPDAGSCGTAAYCRAPVVAEDLQSDPRWVAYRALAAAHGLRACWSTPIFSTDGGVLGTFAMYFRGVRRPEPEHERLIAIVTQTASIAIQRDRTEKAKRDSEGRFRQFFDANQAIKLVIRPTDGRIVDANAAACSFYGYDRTTLLQMRITDINGLPPERVTEELARARWEQSLHFDFAHRLASGEIREVEVYTGPIETADGPLLFSIIHDITERKRAEHSLHSVRHNLETLVAAIPDAIFFKDGAGRWLVTNLSAQQLFHLDGRGWSGRTDAELGDLYPEMAPAHKACLESDEQTWRSGKLQIGEERIVAPDGTAREFEVRKLPQFHADGRRAGLVIIGRDVTAHKQAAEQLRLAEERFEKAFGNSPVAIFFSTLKEGRLLDVNDAFLRLFGAESRAEVIGRTSLELNLWADAQDRTRIAEALKQSGSLRDVECGFRRRTGECGVALAYIERIELHGETCVLSFLNDITERKRAETFRETLLALEVQLSTANSPLEAGRIIFAAADRLWPWDAGYLEVYSEDQDLMHTVLDIDRVDDRRQEVEPVQALAPPSPRSRRIMKARAELTLRRPPFAPFPDAGPFGETSRLSASLMTVPVRWKSRPVGILSVQSYLIEAFSPQDLHTLQGLADHCGGALERLRAAEALRHSEARLTEIFANLDDAVFILNMTDDGRLVYDSLNPRGEQLAGLTWREAHGRTPEAVLPPEAAADLGRQLRACLETRAVIHYESEVTLHSAQRSWSTTLVPIRNEHGRIYRIAGISRDVTQRRQMEEQLRQAQKMEAIGQLAGGISHDFNNMLTAIILQAELSGADETLPPEVREALGEIIRTAKRSAALTRQLLLFSRRQVMQLQSLDLNELVTGISGMLRRVLGEDIALQLKLCPGRLPVQADASMIDQVILNLAVNARDAMPRGGQLLLETDRGSPAHSDETASEQVVLRVRDTGTGIPPEVLPHIFEPFFTTKETGKGTGLGLATVFGIVKQHNGWIDVQSETPSGTVFQVFLPRAAATQPAIAAPARPPHSPGGTETILVVEDEPAIRTTVRLVLTQKGYTVLEAPDGPAALEIWRTEKDRIDLLFTDLVMPGGLSGRELAEQCLASAPKLKVIFSTGYSRTAAGREFGLAAGQGFLAKPFGPNDLLQIVHRTLKS